MPNPRVLLELEFSGLCALVLNNKDPDNPLARVLLLRAEKILGYKKSQTEKQGLRWSARLCVPRLNLSPSTAADETLETFGGDQLAVWRLDGGSTLEIINAAAEPLVVSSGQRKRKGKGWKNEKPSPTEPPEDISWLPEMERIVPGAGKLKRGLWDGWGGDDEPLLGKVILNSGRIEAIQPTQRTYKFHDGYQQCFANGIRARIWLENNEIGAAPVAWLRLTRPDRVMEIELVEYPEGSGEPIRVSVTNHSGSSDVEHSNNSDPHFKAFYALSQKGATLKPEHQLVPKDTGGGGIHSKVRPCMGIVFEE
jgi:hypothetical protein